MTFYHLNFQRFKGCTINTKSNFIGIPHQVMLNMIRYKANLEGIVVVETEESYTSQTSFLDHEMPIRKRRQDEKEAGKVPCQTPNKTWPVSFRYRQTHQRGYQCRIADPEESSPNSLCQWDRGDWIIPGQAKSELLARVGSTKYSEQKTRLPNEL